MTSESPRSRGAPQPGQDPSGAVWINPAARQWRGGQRSSCRDFHARLPDYRSTPLHSVPALADRLGVGSLFVKDESSRMGLPAFKILGASWGTYRAMAQRLGCEPRPWADLDQLRGMFTTLRDLRLLAATEGNHGRAVARMGRLLGLRATILIPQTIGMATRNAIETEGAQLHTVNGSYDDAVATAAGMAGADDSFLLVQDTAWDGYEQIPTWIAQGYQTLFAEIDEQSTALIQDTPDLVVVPTGVGALLSAAVAFYHCEAAVSRTAVLAVEPHTAACVLASLRAAMPVSVATGSSVMDGLNCGTVSTAAWPVLRQGLDAATTVTDAETLAAVEELAKAGILAGPCGAAPLAAMTSILARNRCPSWARAALGLTATAKVVLLDTEGPRTR